MSCVFDMLDERLRKAIAELGYKTPTPIQEQSIPYLLEGRDLIGCAQTGTGKTAAFLLPILHRLVMKGGRCEGEKGGRGEGEKGGRCEGEKGGRGEGEKVGRGEGEKGRRGEGEKKAGHPRALILSPTRELAAQTAHNLVDYSKYTRTHYAIVFGGVSQFLQVKDLQRGAEVVVATPGRLIDLMTQGFVYLDRIEEFVLDEADRMLDMGFFPDIRRIIGKLPDVRHSMFFSATLSPQIRKLAGELVRDPMQISISPERPTVDKIRQYVMCVDKGSKDNLLGYLLKTHPEWKKVIVFARTRHGADRVERKLRRADVKVAAIHSDKTQGQRTRALDGFRDGAVRVLVATDIASRGIDVPDVDLVVNMELPVETESYVHRIGRTARAGESGTAISFVAPEERVLLKSVERFIRQSIPIDRDHPFHSVAAEQKSGKTGQGAPQAPWVRKAEGDRSFKGDKGSKGFNGAKGFKGLKKGFAGEKKAGEGFGEKKKFKHPANMHRKRRNRPNFKGRRQSDFRRGG